MNINNTYSSISIKDVNNIIAEFMELHKDNNINCVEPFNLMKKKINKINELSNYPIIQLSN